jgi:hypothetical protein
MWVTKLYEQPNLYPYKDFNYILKRAGKYARLKKSLHGRAIKTDERISPLEKFFSFCKGKALLARNSIGMDLFLR